MLGIGLYTARHFTGGSGMSGWTSRVGCILMFSGGLANVVVVIVNRGKMPVRIDEIEGERRFSYEPMHSKTRLWYLGDCIHIGGWYFSPGDVGLYVGLVLMIGSVVLPQLIG
jgi:hypothetical protein